MAVARRSQRTRTLLFALLLVGVTLVTIDSRAAHGGVLGQVRGRLHDGLAPVQSATHAALAPLGNFLTGAADYGSLRAENDRLRRQIAAMQAQSIAAAAATAEAQAIIAGAHLSFVGSIPTVQALVIDQGSSNFDNAITLDKGSADGLAVGQPVVAAGVGGPAGGATPGGLVGSVGAVSAHTATVDLLTDPGAVVGVSLPGANTGTAEGVGPGSPLKVTVISTAAAPPQVHKGDAVATSGLPLERYPAGIPVGTVASVTTSSTNAEPAVTLKPLVDLGRLDVVEVELWSPQTAAGAAPAGTAGP
ncbi:MAG TPA: rod shape-determining protein MreC [Acidimicrobiales bacterium]|nr:rod shape-determining protein MreC [Acidimicrobiales bacterium]